MKNAVPPIWQKALALRRQRFAIHPQSTLRLLDAEDDFIRCDRLGPVCWFYCYHLPTEKDLRAMAAFAELAGCPHWHVQHMQDRGHDPQTRAQWGSEVPNEWIANEEGLDYYFRREQGLSPGLFLDQRANRRWLQQQARGRRVLNLFSYTGGFSLNAARGGAEQVASVDLSRTFLDWSKANFALNGITGKEWEFWAADARYFLRGCAKRHRRFDLVVCDPPSFARGPEGVFRLEKDLGGLLAQIDAVLEKDGILFLSTNYEKWDQDTLGRHIRETLDDRKYLAIELPPPDADQSSANARLKGLALRRI
ncbi:MAG: class I SAM-dependent rRNA methyltransferase [Candidatus Latescibacterota bacterium]|jgi:23S rRNA (cytosine1962-C5)-methyltransferase